MNKILKKSLLSGLFFYSQLTLAQKISSDMSIDELQERMTTLPRVVTDKGMEMSIAKMPQGYECPLFSNSPYGELVEAMEGLSSAIKTLPDCDDRSNSKMRDEVQEQIKNIVKGIADVKKTKDLATQSQTVETVNRIVDYTTELQKNLVAIVNQRNDPGNKCYKSSSPSAEKNIVFRVNSAFQSIAPLALDFAGKNPVLRNSLDAALPVLVGAKSVSNGIALLETALSEIRQYNIEDSKTRQAIIENTCSFMKLFNRVELLNDKRIDRIKTVTEDLKKRLEKAKVLKQNTMMEANLSRDVQVPLIYIGYVKENLASYSSVITSRQAIIMKEMRSEVNTAGPGQLSAAGVVLDKKNPPPARINVSNRQMYEASCGAVESLYTTEVATKLMQDIFAIGSVLKFDDKEPAISSSLALQLSQFKLVRDAFRNKHLTIKSYILNDIVNAKDDKLINCVQKGKEWVLSLVEAYDGFNNLVKQLEKSELEKSSVSKDVVAKLKSQDQKFANLQDNKAKFDLFSQLTESLADSEFTIRFDELPKYLFNGPQSMGYKSGNGPVYELLKNLEGHFNIAKKDFSGNILKLRLMAANKVKSVYGKFEASSILVSRDFNQKQIDNMVSLDVLRIGYIVKGTSEHRNICGYLKEAKKNYMDMTTHVMSLVSMCKMIEPILYKKDVSSSLRNYCLAENDQNLSQPLHHIQELFVPNGPQVMFGSILKKLSDLECPDSETILSSY